MENRQIEITTTVGEFYVDIPNNRLIWKENPVITVPLEGCRFDGSAYNFSFQEFYQDYEYHSIDEILIEIPKLLDIDRSGFIKAYGLENIDISGLSDNTAKVLQPAFVERLKRHGVTIEIADGTYEVDYANNRLLPISDYNLPLIHLNDIDNHSISPRGSDTCIFLLDSDKMRITTNFDENTIAVSIRNPYLLDPVGYAKFKQANLTDYIMKSGPLKNHYIAKTMKLTSNDETKLSQRNKPKTKLHR